MDSIDVPEPDYAEPQRQVQRWMGRCLLSLQQSERLLKALLHDSAMTVEHKGGSERGANAFQVSRAYEQARLSKMTLGQLVGSFFGDIVAAQGTEAGDSKQGEVELSEDKLTIQVRRTVAIEEKRLLALRASMQEQVELRNELVHHLIERFDLRSVTGCSQALDHLKNCYDKAEIFRSELMGFAKSLIAGSQYMASAMDTPQFKELLFTGRFPLDGSTVVRALSDAAQNCQMADDGSVLLSDVLAILQTRYPDETPERYGRASWPQLIHESGLFTIIRMGTDGRRGPPRLIKRPSQMSQTN